MSVHEGWAVRQRGSGWEGHLFRVLVVVVLCAVSIVSVGAGTAAAAPTFQGEQFVAGDTFANTTFQMTNIVCAATNTDTSSFDFTASGTATGPIPGTFTESGSISFVGTAPSPITMNATFTLSDASGVVATGTKTANGEAAAANGACGVPAGDMHVVGTVAYHVAFPGSGTTEDGFTQLAMSNDNAPNQSPNPGYSMFEGFGPPPMTTGVTGTVTLVGTFPPGTTFGAAACPGSQGVALGCQGFASAFAGPAGQYSLPLTPGTWSVVGFALPGGNLSQAVASAPVSVTLAQDQVMTENFSVTAPPRFVPATVTGTVTVVGPVPPGTIVGVVACMTQFNTTCPLVSPAALTVSPNSGLSDPATVSVTGSLGFPAPGTSFSTFLSQCAPATGCDASSRVVVPVQADGTWGPVPFTVRQHINVAVQPDLGGATVPVDCAVSACDIESWNGGPEPGGPSAPISFAGGISGARPPSPYALADASGHYTLNLGLATTWNIQAFVFVGGQPAQAVTTAPVVVNNIVPGNTYVENFTISFGTAITTSAQAMDGDMKVAAGSTMQVGFDFTMPGQHPAATVAFIDTTVTFSYTCVTGGGGGTLVIPITTDPFLVGVNDTTWHPSGDQNSALTYQGSAVVPTCPTASSLVRFQHGGYFSSRVASTDHADKVNIRWHYKDGTGGGWSATYSVVPG